MSASSSPVLPSPDHPPVLAPDWPAPLTRQDVFNHVWSWAKTHDRCGNAEGCQYRNDLNTNACLIGACIPDSVYREHVMPEDEYGSTRKGYYVGMLLDLPPIRVLFARDVDVAWADDLQRIHDSYGQPSHLRKGGWGTDRNDQTAYRAGIHDQLCAFALKHNLTIPSE